MKAKEAPEKLYITYKGYGVFDEDSTVERTKDSQTEYTRTDALIKKVINFLNYKLDDVVATRVPGTIIPNHVVKQELIDDLKKYMKGE